MLGQRFEIPVAQTAVPHSNDMFSIASAQKIYEEALDIQSDYALVSLTQPGT